MPKPRKITVIKPKLAGRPETRISPRLNIIKNTNIIKRPPGPGRIKIPALQIAKAARLPKINLATFILSQNYKPWWTYHKLKSSNVEGASYDPAVSEMRIYFYSGGVYRYKGVPLDVFVAFMSAQSHGKFMWDNIREKYPYMREGDANGIT